MIKYTENTQLDRIELEPNSTAIGSVLWLHGLGADGYDFLPIVPELQLTVPIRFIFPHAPLRPVTINNGYVMRAWFDIKGLSFDSHVDEQGIAQSTSSLHNWIKNEQDRGIPSERIILAGFSQGAVIALHAGLRYPERLGGILALSGALPAAAQLFQEKNVVNASVPIFIAHGTEDGVLPIRLGEMSASLLKNEGYSVTWKQYHMAHSVCPEEVIDISKWLINTLKT